MEQDAKDLAVVFIDIARSTEFYERLGDQTAKTLVSLTIDIIRQQTKRCRGEIVRIIGDEALCIFPSLDHCLLAVTELSMKVLKNETLSEHGVALRVGLSYGPIIIDENKEIYGDVVNVAARMRSLALEGQVLLPDYALAKAGSAAALFTRSLGPLPIKGKQAQIEIIELLWNSLEKDLTSVAGMTNANHDPISARIEFTYAGGQHTFDREEFPIWMGRDSQNALTITFHQVSRKHAVIEAQGAHFVIRDQSTNGTLLQIEQNAILTIHRSQAYLHDSGRIVLGKAEDPKGSNTITFRCT